MGKLLTFLKVIFSLLLIAVFVYGFYAWMREVWEIFSSVDPKLGAGMIAASATVIVSVITVVFSKRQEHKIDVQNQLRERKVPVYERIIEFIFLITFADKLGKKQPSEKEMIKFFANTTKDLVIWGSKDIVKAFGDFRDGLTKLPNNQDPAFILAVVEDLLFAIRKDLGHQHIGTKRGDILRLYINDLPLHFPQHNK